MLVDTEAPVDPVDWGHHSRRLVLEKRCWPWYFVCCRDTFQWFFVIILSASCVLAAGITG